MKQFTFNGEYLNDELYFKNSENVKDFLIFKDGFNLDFLFDIDGQFYLIHPKEDKIIRNCANQIIRNKENNKKISEIDYNFTICLKFFDILQVICRYQNYCILRLLFQRNSLNLIQF